jgi:hypothetical protein
MRSQLIFGLSAIAFVACVFPTDGCGCPSAFGAGTIAGVVQRSTGIPASRVRVRAEVSLKDCSMSALVDTALTWAGTNGVYRHDLRAYSVSDTACVRLTAVDTAGGRRDTVTISGIRMRLIPSYGTNERPDSLRIDLVLP